jgi:flagellar basal-body rod modification protein FlgD
MSVTSINDASTATSGKTTTGASTNALGKDDFMKLLIAQLSHQNPLDPLNDQQFIAQMSQLSSLDATQNMNKTLTSMVASGQRAQALQMVGRDVTYTDAETLEPKTGKVSAVLLHDSAPVLLIGGAQIPFDAVQSVQ